MDKSAYIDSVCDVIQSQSPSGEPVTAARLGLELRRAQDGPGWMAHGFNTLKSLLQEMERLELLRIVETNRGALAVQIENMKRPPSGDSPSVGTGRPTSRVRLRQNIWAAFVIAEPGGERFLNKATGETRMGLREPPVPADDWLQVIPISSDAQRAWAQEFLRDRNLSSNLSIIDSLTPNDWHRSFPEALRKHSPVLATEWNRRRSRLVVDEVRRWCAENELNPEIAFERQVRQQQHKRSPATVGRSVAWDEESMRLIVLDALADTPSDWLLNLSIPSRHIFRALAKRSGHSK